MYILNNRSTYSLWNIKIENAKIMKIEHSNAILWSNCNLYQFSTTTPHHSIVTKRSYTEWTTSHGFLTLIYLWRSSQSSTCVISCRFVSCHDMTFLTVEMCRHWTHSSPRGIWCCCRCQRGHCTSESRIYIEDNTHNMNIYRRSSIRQYDLHTCTNT